MEEWTREWRIGRLDARDALISSIYARATEEMSRMPVILSGNPVKLDRPPPLVFILQQADAEHIIARLSANLQCMVKSWSRMHRHLNIQDLFRL